MELFDQELAEIVTEEGLREAEAGEPQNLSTTQHLSTTQSNHLINAYRLVRSAASTSG